MCKKTTILIFIAAIFIIPNKTFALSFPRSNNSSLEVYFPGAKLDNPNILKLVKSLKKNPFSPFSNKPEIRELAAYGGEVIPYMLNLAGERKRTIYLRLSGGLIYLNDHSPYLPAAAEVLNQVENPSAIPNIKKIVFSPLLGLNARKHLIKMGAQFDAKEARLIIDHDRGGVINVVDDYLYFAKFLPPEEQAEVFVWFIQSGAIVSGAAIDNVNDLRQFRGEQIRAAVKIIRFLADTGSPVALKLLTSQNTNLTNSIEKAGTNIYNEGAAKMLLTAYKEALIKLK